MSSKATSWAWQQKVKPSSAKLLLMAIADCANPETGLAFPSVDCLVDMTGQDRKTVISGLEKLSDPKALRMMQDTGARTGRTKQIPIYQLAPWVKEWRPEVTVGKTGLFETGPLSDGNSPDSGGEESRIRDTEPSIGTKEGTITPTPDGVAPPDGDLFNGELPEEPPQPLEEFVAEQWAVLKGEHPGVANLELLSPARITKIAARAGDVVKAMRKKKIEITPEQVWRRIFVEIRKSAFLCGRAPPGRGRTTPFKLRIDYVLRQSEFFNIWDGGYDDGEQHGPGRSFDAGTGRQFGPAESAARRAVDRIYAPEGRRAG